MAATIAAHDFERIVAEYQGKLHGFARRITHSHEDAEEVVQDAFLRAHRALARMPDEQRERLHLKGWLFTITLNVARNHLRKKGPRLVSLDSADDPARLLARHVDRETPETALDDRAGLLEIEALLQLLPEHLRPAARMRFIDDRTHSEIARAFCQPIGTVKSHLHRATAYMRRAFAEAA
jgi:RNA polymerase sigma-70 factor, ECF subfamily